MADLAKDAIKAQSAPSDLVDNIMRHVLGLPKVGLKDQRLEDGT